ncbi:Hypothetical predicted protein [Paramuricea clavata]|uniref:Uncharacterized protein n=1 Tax=Paramuricea clavata TaxID=317549 RepID=A0A7D9DCE5_PARCT|nr:Hypothetical predicted protein [Paramuricea clavata]
MRNSGMQIHPPAFNVHTVVEEVRRNLGFHEEKTPEAFMNNCVKTLEKNVDNLIYYGISMGDLQPPRCSSVDGKLCHLLKGINLMFKSKSRIKQKVDIVHFIEDDEEPDKWQQKRQAFVPGLLVMKSNGAMVLLGNEIFLSFNEKEILRAVVAFLATFYLLDMDYPTNWLASMSFLQQLIFKDNQIHPDCDADVKKAIKQFECFTE